MGVLVLLISFWICLVVMDVTVILPIDLFAALSPSRWMVLLGLGAVLSLLIGE
jgi:hypothetical protein